MIAASEPQEFVPSGRQQALRHPGPCHSPPKKFIDEADELLLDKFEKVSLKERTETESWKLRKAPIKQLKQSWSEGTNLCVQKADLYENSSCSHRHSFSFKNDSAIHSDCHLNCSSKLSTNFMEDELYLKGNTVVWSRGLGNCDNFLNGRKTICSYTSSHPIKHAIWCNFECEHPTYETEAFPKTTKRNDIQNEKVPSLCILDMRNIHIFTQKGEDFISALPFQVGNIWNTRYGVFLEREHETPHHNSTLFDSKASVYSLAFPLDEISPVAINIDCHTQILNNSHLNIVYTNEDPSICMIYDTQTRQHSIYYVRKITVNEKNEIVNRMNATCQSATSLSNRLKSRLSMWDCVNKNSNYLTLPSPMNSRPGSVASFYNHIHHSTRSHSSMATVSRCQSPATSSMGSPWLHKAPRLITSIPCESNNYATENNSFFDSSKIMSYLHTSPNICLDHLWTDPQPTNEDLTLFNSTSKVFLCNDLTDQWYLCYVIPTDCQLRMVEIDYSDPASIHFGSMHNVTAKDAICIPALHMLAILEANGNVMLYSGPIPVGKLHIGGTLVQHTPSPYVRRSLPTFNTPFPRRSSLLPHCKQADLKFDDHLLSPVLPETSTLSTRTSNVLQLNFQIENNVAKAVLSGLCDPIENRIILKYTDGTCYKITLPPITSHPLINDVITVLKQCLTKDKVSGVLIKWFATRNAFGTQDISLEQEWNIFESLLKDVLGYRQQDLNEECPVTPLSNPKKLKHSSSGNDDDWLYLSNSLYESKVGRDLKNKLHINSEAAHQNIKREKYGININAILFSQMKLLHFALHLLYENLKLDILRSNDIPLLAKFLNSVSCDLKLKEYSLHYWKDFPDLCKFEDTKHIGENEQRYLKDYFFVPKQPPNIMEFIYNLMINRNSNEFYIFLNSVNNRSKDIIEICGVIFKELKDIADQSLVKTLDPHISLDEFINTRQETLREGSPPEQATRLMTSKNITVRDLETLPPAIYLLLYSTLWKCRTDPPADLPIEAYYLLWRDDLAAQARKIEKKKLQANNDRTFMYKSQLQGIVPSSKQVDCDQQDGMEDIDNPLIKLRFPDDTRVAEARKMLQSSKPVPIVLVQRPDVSDHDFIEEQEKHLYAICTRTMALSPGRGMFTLRTSTPVITEPLQIPQLCLSGKAPPRGTTVELNHIDTPSNMNLWPLFHNGVANGLRITPDAHNIDNTWITFNKPRSSDEQQMEHAGFLMALGLNGHLRNLHALNTYDYLIKLQEMTSIGILLGLATAFRGTSDINITKALSIHLEALLPPTSMEMDVHQNVQVAALLGIGLVYQGTPHRHIIEVLLSEIGRPPGPEMENSVDRESYSLAAGLSLGLVTLKQGSCSLGLSDLNISDRLHYYMVGGKRRALTGAQKDKYKVPSFQIREGTCVNLDVTAPGATIALGLMYFGTGNKAVADWMAPPETQYLLDFVRPDFLLFRILARALILWDDIKPTIEWVESQVPSTIRPYCMIKPVLNSDIDYEAMNQAYCNIVTGACFALGLKYAGSANEDAFQTLLHFCHLFTNLTIKSIAELAGKPTVETCLNVLLLSASMVMAGTGNLQIMRFVRLLRRRVGVASTAVVTYGSHLALHMTLGLLFLGGGRYTLSNTPENIAALICAFYPKFPTHSNDNRYHLQAFRHLYVLAVEPRLIIPKDVHSGKSCYASLTVVHLNGTTSYVKGPGIIPNLNSLQKVSVDDERYWPVVFKKGQNWDVLVSILSTNGFIEVKQRAGCLSYVADKLGYLSQLAKTLTQSEIVPWDPPSSAITSFTQDKAIKLFCDQYLAIEDEEPKIEELKIKQMLTKVTYDAVVKDKLVVVPVITFLLKSIYGMKTQTTSLDFWQIKLILAQMLSNSLACNMISTELALAFQQQIIENLESWEPSLLPYLQAFQNGTYSECENEITRRLVKYVIFYDIPYNDQPEVNLLEAIIKNVNKYSVVSLEKNAKVKRI